LLAAFEDEWQGSLLQPVNLHYNNYQAKQAKGINPVACFA